MVLMFGIGFIVIENVIELPVQPLAIGVTVIVATTGILDVLVAVKEGILPVPLAAKPIEVSLLVQLNVVPDTEPEKLIAATVPL